MSKTNTVSNIKAVGKKTKVKRETNNSSGKKSTPIKTEPTKLTSVNETRKKLTSKRPLPNSLRSSSGKKEVSSSKKLTPDISEIFETRERIRLSKVCSLSWQSLSEGKLVKTAEDGKPSRYFRFGQNFSPPKTEEELVAFKTKIANLSGFQNVSRKYSAELYSFLELWINKSGFVMVFSRLHFEETKKWIVTHSDEHYLLSINELREIGKHGGWLYNCLKYETEPSFKTEVNQYLNVTAKKLSEISDGQMPVFVPDVFYVQGSKVTITNDIDGTLLSSRDSQEIFLPEISEPFSESPLTQIYVGTKTNQMEIVEKVFTRSVLPHFLSIVSGDAPPSNIDMMTVDTETPINFPKLTPEMMESTKNTIEELVDTSRIDPSFSLRACSLLETMLSILSSEQGDEEQTFQARLMILGAVTLVGLSKNPNISTDPFSQSIFSIDRMED